MLDSQIRVLTTSYKVFQGVSCGTDYINIHYFLAICKSTITTLILWLEHLPRRPQSFHSKYLLAQRRDRANEPCQRTLFYSGIITDPAWVSEDIHSRLSGCKRLAPSLLPILDGCS